MAKEYAKYRLNGFVFSSSTHEAKLVGKQNSGISINALDDNPELKKFIYYLDD